MIKEPSLNEKIFNALKKPDLWQRSAAPFWNDEHISKKMLKAHLDADADAASRKPETLDASIKWLAKLIAPNSRILDIGCGPGLYTKRLAELGYDTVGVDISRRSVDYAKAHDPKTKYICADYLTFGFTDGEFDAVTLIYCDYAALTPDERKTVLSKVHRALKPGGLFIFDVFTENRYKEKVDNTSWYESDEGGFWSDKAHICFSATYFYEESSAKADKYVILTEDGIKEYIIWDTFYTEETLRNELLKAGFEKADLYGDVCGKAYTEDSETICAVAFRGELN